MTETLLSVEHLKKSYTGRSGLFSGKQISTQALDDISFTIKKGTTVGLVGESGCGKSTAGKVILRLTEPTGGKVTYGSKTIFDVENKQTLPSDEMTALRRRMQIIFQDPSSCLNPRKNVEQIISEGIIKHNLCKKSEIRGRCIEIMEKCGLDKLQMMRYPHEFSGGQRQRIGIARALAVGPEFIVCDEPTAALDVSIQSQILNLMLDMKEQFSLTYLFISHNLGVVEHFCDEILIMYLGRIVEQGSCAAVYNHPSHPYTRLLMESVPALHPDDKKPHTVIKRKAPASMNLGCSFAGRCPMAAEICNIHRPVLLELDPGHFAACHMAGKS